MELSELKMRENEYTPLSFGNFQKSSVYNFASSIARQYIEFKEKSWISDKYELDINELVKDLGGRISYVDADEYSGWNGSIYIHQKKDFDIILPLYTSVLRDNFTIAHELGHYFLHFKKDETKKMASRMGSSSIEWEANWFAAGLLMPKEIITTKHLSTPSETASFFNVSLQAAETRLNNIEY